MDLSKGKYWDQSWSPIRGCSHASPGCQNCWAERMAGRFSGMLGDPAQPRDTAAPYFGFINDRGGWSGRVELIESELEKPLHWRKPRVIALNWMGDLFHEKVPFEAIDQVFTVMVAASWHTYLVLTKRAKRMREYFASGRHDCGNGPDRADYHLDGKIALGVSCEDQQRADERIPELLRTPAALRWVSLEPLLGDIDLWHPRYRLPDGSLGNAFAWGHGIGWVVVGGESGPGARPCSVPAVRRIIRDCKASAPCFIKQLGDKPEGLLLGATKAAMGGDECLTMEARGPKGQDATDWPRDLRVRELPAFLT